MARSHPSPTPRRNSVPVASRAKQQAAAAAAAKAKPPRRGPDRKDIAGVVVLLGVILIILLTIAIPLRNYYEGRSEIARLNESIAAKQVEKEQLLTDIDRYKNEDYIRQEARRRLGVVGEGELAYRIVDPGMTHDQSLTTDRQAEDDSREWYEVLWDSVAEEPKTAVVSGNTERGVLESSETSAPEAPADAVPGTESAEEPAQAQ